CTPLAGNNQNIPASPTDLTIQRFGRLHSAAGLCQCRAGPCLATDAAEGATWPRKTPRLPSGVTGTNWLGALCTGPHSPGYFFGASSAGRSVLSDLSPRII